MKRLYIILLVIAVFGATLVALGTTTLIWLVCLVFSIAQSWISIFNSSGLIAFLVGFIFNLIYIHSGLLQDLAKRQAESNKLN